MDYLGRKNNKIPYWKRITDVSSYVNKMEEKWKNHYNVYFYTVFQYPLIEGNKKIEEENLIKKI